MTDVFTHLKQLEQEMHRPATRRDVARMKALLHPDFEEIGRSGRRYSREEILQEFVQDVELPEITADEYQLFALQDNAWLLTYTTVHLLSDSERHRQTLRSSIWLETAQGWQLRFHQGTPAAVNKNQFSHR